MKNSLKPSHNFTNNLNGDIWGNSFTVSRDYKKKQS